MKTATATGTAAGTTDDDDDEMIDVPDIIEEIIQLFDDFLWVHGGKVLNTEPNPDSWTKNDIIYGKQKEELIDDLILIFSDWQLM